MPHDGKAASNVIYFVRLRMRELNEKTGNIRYGKAEKKRELRGEEEQRQSNTKESNGERTVDRTEVSGSMHAESERCGKRFSKDMPRENESKIEQIEGFDIAEE